MLQYLSHPNVFFAQKKLQKINFKYPYIIMGILVLLSFINNTIIMAKIEGLVNHSSLTVQQIIIIWAGLTLAALTVLFKWILLAIIFFLLSYFFNGNNNVGRIFEFTAYGFVPLIFASLIDIFFSIGIFYSSLNSSPLSTFTLEQSILHNQYTIISNFITIFSLLWSAFIWIFAVYHSFDLSPKKSIIIVMIPVSIYIILILYFLYPNIIEFFVNIKHYTLDYKF